MVGAEIDAGHPGNPARAPEGTAADRAAVAQDALMCWVERSVARADVATASVAGDNQPLPIVQRAPARRLRWLPVAMTDVASDLGVVHVAADIPRWAREAHEAVRCRGRRRHRSQPQHNRRDQTPHRMPEPNPWPGDHPMLRQRRADGPAPDSGRRARSEGLKSPAART